jgi:PAS domain S-box-containing protein
MKGTTMYESDYSPGGVGLKSTFADLSAEDRFRILMESAFDWEYWQLPDGSFEYVSPSCERITGYTPQEFMRTPELYFEIIHPDDRSRVRRHHCQADGKQPPLEFRLLGKDGRERWIEHYCRQIYDRQSQFLGCRASNRDVTARKQAEIDFQKKTATAEENSRLLESLVNYAPVGIVVADAPDLSIHFISNRGCELEGRSREELSHGTAEQYRFFFPDGRAAATDDLPLSRATRDGEQVVDEEWVVLRPDGIRVNILCNAGPIFDGNGNITGAVMAWQDITKRKRNELLVEQSQRKLVALKDQLESKNKEMEAIICAVSHDLRSPLVSIQGFSQEIQFSLENAGRVLSALPLNHADVQTADRILNTEIPEFLRYIRTSATAMDQLVKSLVKVARVGMAELDPEWLDMDELISNVAGSLGFELKEADIKLELEPLADCYADRQQVTQIFSNLVDNAVKYRHPDRQGRIRISGRAEQGLICYCVDDNGIGIPPEHQKRVFNLFDRVGQQGKGEGIGLAIVKRMAERNGGSVRVESEPGKGTCFSVCLPAKSVQ